MELEATLRWTDMATRLAAPYGINPAVILAMIYVESRGDPVAMNPKSMATGLMQVMPKESHVMFADRPTSAELLDPEINIAWGLKVLSYYMHKENGSLSGAIYRYSGGSSWRNMNDFVARYWLVFAEAWALIELAMRGPE